MGVLDEFEKKLGIPAFGKILPLLSGENGKMLESMLKRLEKLSQDTTSMQTAAEVLHLLIEADEKGTLARLDSLLKELQPLIKDKTFIKELVSKFDKLEQIATNLMKE